MPRVTRAAIGGGQRKGRSDAGMNRAWNWATKTTLQRYLMFQRPAHSNSVQFPCSIVKMMTIFGVALTFTGAAHGAGPWHDVTDIEAAARVFAERSAASASLPTEVRVNSVDPRLRVHQCDQPLHAYLPSSGPLRNNGVVGVRCTSPVGWKLFVPVRLVQTADVAHVVGHLTVGHRLTATDVRWVNQELRGNASAFLRGQQDPVGQVLRQAASDGQLLRPNMLRAANLIHRGDQVTLAVSGSALAIRMSGEALADAALGQRIQARNRSSGRVVEGIVRGAGLVEISIF